MALLQFTALISGIQGKLQGSVISRGRSGNVIYNRPTQRREPTTFQLGIRAGFASASYAWKQLSPAHKLDWLTISTNNPVPNRFNDLVILSGFDYFKKMVGLTFPLGVSAPIIPNLSVSQPYQHSPVSASAQFSITNEGFVLDSYSLEFTTINDSSFANLVNVYISLPVPGFDEPYYKTWYLVSQFQVLANLGPNAPIILAGNNVLMPSGWRAFADSPILFKTVAFIPSTGKISVDQIYPFVINLSPPPVFPDYFATGGGQFTYIGINLGWADYFFSSTQKAIVISDYTQECQFSTPRQDFISDPSLTWLNTTSSIFTINGGPDECYPLAPPNPQGWFDVFLIDTAWVYPGGGDWRLPARSRLVRISDGQKGVFIYNTIAINNPQ